MNNQQTHWACIKCERKGSIEYESGVSIWNMLPLLTASHREVSPKCEASLGWLRIISCMPIWDETTDLSKELTA